MTSINKKKEATTTTHRVQEHEGRRCFDCNRVERTSSRAGLTPAVDHHLFTAHPTITANSSPCCEYSCQQHCIVEGCSLIPKHRGDPYAQCSFQFE